MPHSAFPADVELWYSQRGGATATALALRKHWLQDEFAGGGVRLLSLEQAASRDIRLSHYHHGHSGLLREGSNVSAIWARARGQQAVVVGITSVDEFQGVFVRAGGKLRELADLKHRRLGLPLRRHALVDLQRASALRGLRNALTVAGLAHDAANWVHIESPDFEYPQRVSGRAIELEALLSGYVDAVFLRGAQGVAAARDGRLQLLADLNQQADPLLRANSGTPRTITVDQPFLQRHPQLVARYLAALLRTAEWARHNGQAVRQLVALETPEYAPEIVAASHGPALQHAFTPQLGEAAIAALTAQKDFLRETGFIRSDIDIAQWIAPAPLRDALRLQAERTRAAVLSSVRAEAWHASVAGLRAH